MARYILRRNCFSCHFVLVWSLICNWLVVSQQSPSLINDPKRAIEHPVPYFLDGLDQSQKTVSESIKIEESDPKPIFQLYRHFSSKENNNFPKLSTSLNNMKHNFVRRKAFINKNRGVPANEVDLVLDNVHGKHKPFLEASLKTPTNLHFRKTRAALVESSAENLKNYAFENNSTYRKIEGNCLRKSYYISFKKLGWEDSIIAPDGYDAYYCDGQSKYLDNNHGRMMNITGNKIPSDIPKSCCVPTELSPLMVLYFNEEREVILKKFSEMIVKSCGCL